MPRRLLLRLLRQRLPLRRLRPQRRKLPLRHNPIAYFKSKQLIINHCCKASLFITTQRPDDLPRPSGLCFSRLYIGISRATLSKRTVSSASPLTVLWHRRKRLLLGSGTDVKSLATFSSGPDLSERLRRVLLLLNYADNTMQEFDELLIERSKKGTYWVHFAVRPKENRRKVCFIQT
jgi:hypothetical protein